VAKVRPGAKRLKSRPALRIKTLSARQIRTRLAAQKDARRLARRLESARHAIKSFRPRKIDRGRLVFIGIHGQRDPAAKGRRGYLAYITRTGKKWLIKDQKAGVLARKIGEIEPPIRRNLRRAIKEFSTARRVMVSKHRAVNKGSGNASGRGQNDFSEKVVEKLAKSIRQALTRQKSHRTFLINANVLVRLPNGIQKVYSVIVPITRPDHVSIRIGGIRNFVRQKFYAFMAKELAFDGFVSSGSANHIRRFSENYGARKGDWTTKDGEQWAGNDLEIVKIERIEWKIEQST
jgi:hypothetical protein